MLFFAKITEGQHPDHLRVGFPFQQVTLRIEIPELLFHLIKLKLVVIIFEHQLQLILFLIIVLKFLLSWYWPLTQLTASQLVIT